MGCTMSAETSREGEADSSNEGDPNSSTECPTCGREDFANRRGMKTHHKKIHGESLAYTVICDYCGSETQHKKTVAEQNEHNFCNNDCRGAWLSENVTGEDHPDYIEPAESTCEHCESIFTHPHHEDRTFCGTDCRNEYRSKNGEETNLWKGGKVTIECERCGVEFGTYPSRVGQKKYCSKECQYKSVELECEWCGCSFEVVESRSETARCCSQSCWGQLRASFPQEEQPGYKGGKTEYDYGPNWYPQRRKARKRDQYRCRICGRDERQLGKKPSCHHITKLRYYRDNYGEPEWYERGNRLENLILLCEEHHKEWEGIPLAPQ